MCLAPSHQRRGKPSRGLRCLLWFVDLFRTFLIHPVFRPVTRPLLQDPPNGWYCVSTWANLVVTFDSLTVSLKRYARIEWETSYNDRIAELWRWTGTLYCSIPELAQWHTTKSPKCQFFFFHEVLFWRSCLACFIQRASAITFANSCKLNRWWCWWNTMLYANGDIHSRVFELVHENQELHCECPYYISSNAWYYLALIRPRWYIGQVPPPVMLETWLRESRVRLPTIIMLETWLRESGVPRQTFWEAQLIGIELSHFLFQHGANNSLVVYRTSRFACHAWNMAAGEQGSTPRARQANFVFVHWFLSIMSWSYMIIKWLLRRSVRSSMLLLRCASVLHAPQSLCARARFADPVRIPLRHCLPCSCLHHAVLLVIALFMSRHCAHTFRLHPHSVFGASFLADNTSRISCHVRRFIRHAVDMIVVLSLVIHLIFLDSFEWWR